MTFDQLGVDDIPAALALGAAEGWNQTATDWERLIRLQPAGCFAARNADRLAGTVTTLVHEATSAWIGMMIVDPSHRRRGLGAALMRRALEYLEASNVTCVGLDATPAGYPLYESLGFAPYAQLERWQGVVTESGSEGSCQPNEPLDAVLALDRAAYGVDRSRVLRSLAEQVGSVLMRRDSDVGYAMARPGRTAVYVGPLVATTDAAATELLDAMLARFTGKPVCLDVPRGGFLRAGEIRRRGLSTQRVLTRMYRGAPNGVGLSPRICASAGPELG